MDPDLRDVHKHMRQLGITIIGRAIADATSSEITRPFGHALAVVHAAHGAEIVVKARIAQEHPLLLFKKRPALSSAPSRLSQKELFKDGRTVDYLDLPDLLWAATGYRMAEPVRFKKFGELRNQIVHFAVPEKEHDEETLRFCIEVMEPLLSDFWAESAIPVADTWDNSIVSDGYLLDRIKSLGIVAPECAKKQITEAMGRDAFP